MKEIAHLEGRERMFRRAKERRLEKVKENVGKGERARMPERVVDVDRKGTLRMLSGEA